MAGMSFDECKRKGKIVRTALDASAINKELASAEYDVEKARKDFEDGDFKWATIKAYYSAFHAARALLLREGYIEKSHRCLLAFLEAFFPELVMNFSTLMMLRETADYESHYSKSTSSRAIELAEQLVKAVLDKLKGP